MTLAPEQTAGVEPVAAASAAHSEAGSGRRTALSFLFTPAVLAVALLGLYLYVHSRTLDTIEQRSLTRAVIRHRVFEHVRLTAVSTVLVILIAIPLGIMLTRPAMRRATPFVLAIVNIGQAVPSIGVLVLLALLVDVGFGPAVVALVLYSVLPVLRNTMAGLQRVDRSLIDAARGMGMPKRLVLFRVELPLAVPVMMAGIRTALIINVGTATLAAFTNAGGLGEIINAGLVLDRKPVLITGAVLVAVSLVHVDAAGCERRPHRGATGQPTLPLHLRASSFEHLGGHLAQDSLLGELLATDGERSPLEHAAAAGRRLLGIATAGGGEQGDSGKHRNAAHGGDGAHGVLLGLGAHSPGGS